jgi:hypothetical protein
VQFKQQQQHTIGNITISKLCGETRRIKTTGTDGAITWVGSEQYNRKN